uniref:DNA repair protein XRCC1 n=1 Tax=Mastacembelus armatus TaxID=205130 RepID=A0A7N8YPR6_9TELE
MPEIKLKHVVSCSTEDTAHKADNLLSSDTYRKWKAARPGEKQTSVILQFEKEEQVHSIDIGNEGSAFIEVLVGNSSAIRDQDYEVLLVMSSFMSPTESRNGTNMNRVRFFGPNQLQKSTAQEKWDRVKIVCSQPYNKNIAYGVAFVKFHSPPDKNDPSPTTSPKLTKLGQFRVKDDCPSSGPSLKPGSLFFSRDNASKPSASLKGKSVYLTLLKSAEKKKESQSKSKPEPKQQKAKSKVAQQIPFKQIMEGVVFVLSGFQNPFRGELREKALDMGAKYRPDWTPDSTHLICAFANTPKYSQVKSAGGIIVRKEWIIDCHKKRQKISYKQKKSFFQFITVTLFMLLLQTPQKQVRQVTPKKTPEKRRNKEDEYDEYAVSTDVDEPGLHQITLMKCECKLNSVQLKLDKEEDPYGGSTDENTDAEAEEDHPIPELPDFLSGKYFFLYGKFPNNERRLLLRYIVAFNGAIEDYMTEKVQFVVTSEGWQDSFEDALMENGNLNFVKPAWIYAINERQKMLPYQPYSVVP